MDIRGLILVNNDSANEEGAGFTSPPLPLLDIAGQSPLARMASRLEKHGISPVTAVIEESAPAFRRALFLPPDVDCRAAAAERFWRAAENAFNDLVQSGAELIVLMRLGGYAEIDFEKFVQSHLERRCRVSRVVHERGSLEIFCVSASRRNDAASLFRSRLERCRSECEPYIHNGYVNFLADARDWRQLAVDVLTLKTEARPQGQEVRPGIWLGHGAVLEKGSRVLAPAFVGASALVRDAAVITRCSSVEHHAQIDCGTVVENSTVLPYSSVGAGLDLAHSVAGMGLIFNLRRGVLVAVPDSQLLGQVSEPIGERLAAAAGKLSGRVRQFLFGGANQGQPSGEPALESNSQLLQETDRGHEPAADLAPNLAIARRYGDQ